MFIGLRVTHNEDAKRAATGMRLDAGNGENTNKRHVMDGILTHDIRVTLT